MGVKLELKNVKDLGSGKYRFRKPYPPSLQASLGMQLRETRECLTEKALLKWWTGLNDRWDRAVAAQRALEAAKVETPREQWAAGLARAEALLSGVRGISEDEARYLTAESLLARYPQVEVVPEDPKEQPFGEYLGVSAEDGATVKALLAPNEAAPEPNLRDAMKEYLKERIGDRKGRRGRNSAGAVERVFGYAFAALGKRADLPLSALGNSDGLKVRDFMLARPKQGGGEIKPSSVRREMNHLSAALELAIKNFDLEQKAKNIFRKIEISGESEDDEFDKRHPLPLAVIAAISHRLETRKERQGGALSTLRLMWRILLGTGCRVAEVAGLRQDDVQLEGPTPHIRVRWNEERRVKTRTSVRSVPLCGDAYDAAKEAVVMAGDSAALFPRYAGPAGGNNASAALMKHVRAVSSDPKHVVHSLRHNMADWLRLSEASGRAKSLILGHSLGGVGDRVYGGEPVDLRLTYAAMLVALAYAASEAQELPAPE